MGNAHLTKSQVFFVLLLNGLNLGGSWLFFLQALVTELL